jgi:hypothetical protein
LTDWESFERRLDELDPVLLAALLQGGGGEALRRHVEALAEAKAIEVRHRAEMELERQQMDLCERKTDMGIRIARNAVAFVVVATALPFSPWIVTISAAAGLWRRR